MKFWRWSDHIFLNITFRVYFKTELFQLTFALYVVMKAIKVLPLISFIGNRVVLDLTKNFWAPMINCDSDRVHHRSRVSVCLPVLCREETRRHLRWPAGLRRRWPSWAYYHGRRRICWRVRPGLRPWLLRLIIMNEYIRIDGVYTTKLAGNYLPQLSGLPSQEPSSQMICHVVLSLRIPDTQWKVTWVPCGNLLRVGKEICSSRFSLWILWPYLH